MKDIKEIPILSFLTMYSALNTHYSKHEKVNKQKCSGNCGDACSGNCGDACSGTCGDSCGCDK